MSVKGRPILKRAGHKIDVSKWKLDISTLADAKLQKTVSQMQGLLEQLTADVDIEQAILDAASEAIAAAVENEVSVCFAASINESTPKKPLLMHVSLPLGDGDADPVWEFDLRSIVQADLEWVAENSSRREAMAAVADGMRKLADMIDKDLKGGK